MGISGEYPCRFKSCCRKFIICGMVELADTLIVLKVYSILSVFIKIINRSAENSYFDIMADVVGSIPTLLGDSSVSEPATRFICFRISLFVIMKVCIAEYSYFDWSELCRKARECRFESCGTVFDFITLYYKKYF